MGRRARRGGALTRRALARRYREGKQRLMRAPLLVIVLGALCSPVMRADAQPRRGPLAAERRDDAGGGGGGPATAERREQVKKKIRAMRAFTLTEELALDEATASRLFPVLARYDDE